MSTLCASTCCPGGSTSPPAPFETCSQITRKYGYKYFILIACDYQFTDVLDVSEWTTAQTAGDIQCSPAGNIVINPPTETLFQWNNCGDQITTDTIWLIDYTTPFVPDAQDLSDFDYFADLKASSKVFKIIFIDCEGNFILTDNYVTAVQGGAPATVTGESPGFDFSVTVTPHEANQDGLALWTTQFSISKNGVMKKVQLPGVEAALCC